MSDLLLFGPIIAVVAFGWMASVLALRSSRQYRASHQVAAKPAHGPNVAGPAE